MRGWLNVKFSALYEGRSAEKTDPPGGHNLVKMKKNYLPWKEKLEKEKYA